MNDRQSPNSSPDGAKELLGALVRLHLNAGAPSVRQVAANAPTSVSPTTVNDVLSGRRIPKWTTLEQVVLALGGDPDAFRQRWAAAAADTHDLAPRATGSRTAEPAVSVLASEHIVEHHTRAGRLFTEGLYDRAINELDLAVAAVRHNRARALQNLNRWAEAETEYETVIADRTRLLDADHPETLATRNNLALIRFDLGKLEEARAEQLNILVPRHTTLMG